MQDTYAHTHTVVMRMLLTPATKLMGSINMRGTIRLEPVAPRERLEGIFKGGGCI